RRENAVRVDFWPFRLLSKRAASGKIRKAFRAVDVSAVGTPSLFVYFPRFRYFNVVFTPF
ncbi:MAG: hypothetical protein IIW01_01965, partial [Thermoguttaceae bacterium]|nr:hypothetical protein [Thermoguttaceae bacterium]